MGWFRFNGSPKQPAPKASSEVQKSTVPTPLLGAPDSPERRKFMIGVGSTVLAAETAAVVGGSVLVAKKAFGNKNDEQPTTTQEATPKEEAVRKIERNRSAEYVTEGPYETGDLAGRPVADLFAFYLGVPEGTVLPEKLNSKFDEILDGLWQKKLSFVGRKKADWLANTERARDAFVEPYTTALAEGKVESQTLEAFRDQMEPIITNLHNSVDWDKFKTIPAFSSFEDSDVELVKDMAANIDAEILIAYAITELMPARNDSKMNVDVFEFLSKNAGTQFLASIPAIHDPYLSVGMFQFTSLALYEGAGGARGASRINRLVRDDAQKIPGSVIALTTPELQMRAAYLFAVENLGQLVRDVRKDGNKKRREKRLLAMKTKATKMHVGLLQYLASAHHAPAHARRSFIRWMDVDFVGSHADRCSPSRIEVYVKKSHGNYEELRRRL